jgi:NADH:ubiquinone oxidoreductase subunit D
MRKKTIEEMDKLLTGNKIWLERTVGVARFTKDSR